MEGRRKVTDQLGEIEGGGNKVNGRGEKESDAKRKGRRAGKRQQRNIPFSQKFIYPIFYDMPYFDDMTCLCIGGPDNAARVFLMLAFKLYSLMDEEE